MVTGGKDKGKKGKVEKSVGGEAVLVAGVNMYKRHMKRRDEKNPGGVIDLPRPLSVGKVVLLCPKCKLPTRVGFEITAKGKKRICRKCGQAI